MILDPLGESRFMPTMLERSDVVKEEYACFTDVLWLEGPKYHRPVVAK